MRFSVIGPGRVGLALAAAMLAAGHTLVDLLGERPQAARDAQRRLGAGRVVSSLSELDGTVDWLWLTTPDDRIAEVAQALAAAGVMRPGALVCHASGALPAATLAPLEAGGCLIASIHPLQTFARRWPPAPLADGIMVIEAEGEALRRCERLVAALGGRALTLTPGSKALYHAAACVAANHLIGLQACAVELLIRSGIPAEEAWPALWPLVKRTVDNAAEGLVAALTGPIERGDVATVRRHLSALAQLPPEAAERHEGLYRQLALATLDVAAADPDRHGRADRYRALRAILSEHTVVEPETRRDPDER